MINTPITIITIFLINGSVAKHYVNYTLYRGIPATRKDLVFFKNLNNVYTVNFWRNPTKLYKPVEFMIQANERELFLKDVRRHNIVITATIKDVQSAFDKQTVRTYTRKKLESFDWHSYHRLEDIYSWMEDLNRNHPKVSTLRSIGRTNEGRDILALTVAFDLSQIRSKVIIEGGIHAREWIAPAFVTYFINEIIHSFNSTNPTLRNIAGMYEWNFIPVLNPDGYEYTHTHDRLWRKNRSGSNKDGVDLNRNFDIAFCTLGAGKHVSEATYCGPYAFSEKESSAMAHFLLPMNNSLEYYLAFHSYGQYMILPYGHLPHRWDNYDAVKNMCLTAANRIIQRRGTKYYAGTPYETIGYRTSGVSGCWVKAVHRVPYVITFELSDQGYYGFALPPEYILPVCQETMDGVISLFVPRTTKYYKLGDMKLNGQKRTVLNGIMVFCNVLYFIIICFD